MKTSNNISWLWAVSALAFGMIVFGVGRATNHTPVLNPISGKPDPALEKWINRITSTNATGNAVQIDLGERVNGEGGHVLFVLSPVLKMYPRAATFTVSWSWTISKNKFVYNRATRTVFLSEEGWGKPMSPSYRPIRYISDEEIHAAAHNLELYVNIKNYARIGLLQK